MPKNEYLDDLRKTITDRITELESDVAKLQNYLTVVGELEALPIVSSKAPDLPAAASPTPPSSPNKRKYTRTPKEAAVSKTFKPVDEKQCQRCKKTWPADDFEMGEFRPKRVCRHCEDVESTPHKKKGRPGKARLVEPPLVPSAALRISPPDSGGQSPSRVATIRRRPRSGDDPELVYSKPMRCPKCSSPVARFERRADAGPDDMWTCQENNCQLRVGNYNIGVDKSYSGGGAAA